MICYFILPRKHLNSPEYMFIQLLAPPQFSKPICLLSLQKLYPLRAEVDNLNSHHLCGIRCVLTPVQLEASSTHEMVLLCVWEQDSSRSVCFFP